MNGQQRRKPLALLIERSQQGARTLRGDHDNVHFCRWSDELVPDVEPMHEAQRLPGAKLRRDVLAENIRRGFIGERDNQQITAFGGFGDRNRLEPVGPSSIGTATRSLAHNDLKLRVPQVQGVGSSLVAETEHGDHRIAQR